MDNLVIGNTSQLSKYFPEDYVKLSSRNIDKKFIQNKIWDRIFLCFGESRKFITDEKLYDEVNFEYTVTQLAPYVFYHPSCLTRQRAKRVRVLLDSDTYCSGVDLRCVLEHF
jgi:hypothetical protein